jgi:hypothetical protein
MLSFLFAGRNDRIHARLSADAHGPRLPASPLRMCPAPPGSYFPPLIGVDINSVNRGRPLSTASYHLSTNGAVKVGTSGCMLSVLTLPGPGVSRLHRQD